MAGQAMIPTLLRALLLLLVFTTSAAAECAWVLWSNFLSSNPASRYAASSGGLWIPESAGTRTECETARGSMRATLVGEEAMGQGTQPLRSGRAAEAAGVVGPNGQIILTCLPDTIDPRGPKTR